MKKTNNEYDITKSMLETIRLNESNYKKSLNEQQDDIIELTGEELKSYQDNFITQVGATVFGPFKVYPNVRNAVFSGKMDGGIEWQFSLSDGVYIDMPNIELNDEIVQLTKRLNAHFINWKDEWGIKMTNEYKPNE